MLTFIAPELEGYTCRGKVTTKGSIHSVMIMAMERSYTEENDGHVKTQLAEELSMD